MTLIDLPFTNPLLNAAGTLGFNPAPRGTDFSSLGAFFTNPISLAPRNPANLPRFAQFTGGFLLHTGFPNPGLRNVLRKHGAQWSRSEVPVIAHLLTDNPDDTYRAVRVLEERESVLGIELGLQPGVPENLAREIVQSAVGERPVIARAGLEDVTRLIAEIYDAGASAISFGPPRGALPDNQKMLSGRLFGNAVFPQALEILRNLAGSPLSIIFSGGIKNRQQIETVLAVGALAVQLDFLLWRNPEFTFQA